MSDPVSVTVFPRLDCCVPDYTGKNAALVQILRDVRQEVGDIARIEVVSDATRADRLVYYERMVDTLLAGGHELPFAKDDREWAALRRELSALKAGLLPGPGAFERFRTLSVALFWIPPVIGIDGKAAFVTELPSAAQLSEAIRKSHRLKEEDNETVQG
ncbi:MAG: hypothetical protein AB1700_08025 [Bacillota bacterium]